ncbi:hypothetical protein INH39_27545 [Massilia violaceinigra]|uniref:Lanthionine synthetase n=1 Tax=Massilia violaceinigra TaxID=2045208 RepID=A0ABY4A301_9BURK|nr:lanthionine synthetase LanC family protein [Massilia violaceinigra]UOD29132.1 hypothetical protein INH39_27545 [Massilia violaceinigra]
MNARTDLAGPVASTDHQARFLEAADAIGCRLVRDALWHGERCTWMVWTKQSVGSAFPSCYRAAPGGLYLGVAGIALFLNRLARLTGDARQAAAAAGALAQVQARIGHDDRRAYGFYTGSSGAAWALIDAAGVNGEARWKEAGMRALHDLAGNAVLEASLDLLDGQAGFAAVLASVAAAEGDQVLADAAACVADQLVASAVRDRDQVSWPGQQAQSANLVGLSHGTTGIALALLEVDQIRPAARYREAVAGALRYERACYSPAHRNWPDFRAAPEAPCAEPGHVVAWCHGATGMGMARLRMLELMPSEQALLAEVDAALATTVAALNAPIEPGVADVSLCHGISGLNEFLLMAARQCAHPAAASAVLAVGDMLLRGWHARNLPWGCGIPHCGETPSLLTGTAGIGHHFLRLHDPAIPSVLLPPKTLAPARADSIPTSTGAAS